MRGAHYKVCHCSDSIKACTWCGVLTIQCTLCWGWTVCIGGGLDSVYRRRAGQCVSEEG